MLTIYLFPSRHRWIFNSCHMILQKYFIC